MLMFLGLLFVGVFVLTIACRIIAGWVLPARALAATDQGVNKALTVTFQLLIVGLAGVIVYAIWLSH